MFLVSSQLAPKLDLEENSFTWIELEKLTDIAEGGKGNMYAKMEKVGTCLSPVLWTFGREFRALVVTSPIECGRPGDIFRFMLIHQELHPP